MSTDSTPPVTNAAEPDLDAVERFIRAMISRGAIASLVAAILGLLTRMHDLNSELVRKLASQSRRRPPNESMRRLQLELPLVMGLAPPPKPANDGRNKDQEKRDPKNRNSHGRPKLPEHLERIPEIHPVTDAQRQCPTCAVPTKTVGFKTTEKLDLLPARFVVREVKCETVACPKCHGYIRAATKPDEVKDRGLLGNDLLVQALVEHYADAVPWERMERNARLQNVPLSAHTLAVSVGRLIDLFDPVVQHIASKALSSDYLALDATRLPVLDPGHPLGIRSGSLWLIQGAHQYSYFLYAPSGHAEHLDKVLAGQTLQSVMCDGSATNNGVERAGGKRGGCHSHARRGLTEALRGGDGRAAEGLRIYASLFHVDAESKRAHETIALRLQRRQRESAPILQKLRGWLDARLGDVEPKSRLGKALGYMHRQWKRLTAFMRDPTMEMTNNEVERDLRPWVLDRKTWLFVGHDASARRAADALSLITTARKFGIEPRRYLRDTLGKILAGEKDLRALLPETYAQAHVARETLTPAAAA